MWVFFRYLLLTLVIASSKASLCDRSAPHVVTLSTSSAFFLDASISCVFVFNLSDALRLSVITNSRTLGNEFVTDSPIWRLHDGGSETDPLIQSLEEPISDSLHYWSTGSMISFYAYDSTYQPTDSPDGSISVIVHALMPNDEYYVSPNADQALQTGSYEHPMSAGSLCALIQDWSSSSVVTSISAVLLPGDYTFSCTQYTTVNATRSLHIRSSDEGRARVSCFSDWTSVLVVYFDIPYGYYGPPLTLPELIVENISFVACPSSTISVNNAHVQIKNCSFIQSAGISFFPYAFSRLQVSDSSFELNADEKWKTAAVSVGMRAVLQRPTEPSAIASQIERCSFAGYFGNTVKNTDTMEITDSSFTRTMNAGDAFLYVSSDTIVRRSSFQGSQVISSSFSSSSNGGAIFNFKGSLTIDNCTFSANASKRKGGAIYSVDGFLAVTNSTFESNVAESGGAIYWRGCEIYEYSAYANGYGGETMYGCTRTGSVTSSTFTANVATTGGAIHLEPGQNGVGDDVGVVTEGDVTVYLKDVTFLKNSARMGGALYVIERNVVAEHVRIERGNEILNDGGTKMGGAVYTGNKAVVSFEHSVLEKCDNAIYVTDQSTLVILYDVSIISSSSLTSASAFSVSGGQLVIANCTISKSVSERFGAGLVTTGTISMSESVIEDSYTSGDGGAITVNEGFLNLSDSVFRNNHAESFGGAIRGMSSVGRIDLHNVLFEGNSASTGGAIAFCSPPPPPVSDFNPIITTSAIDAPSFEELYIDAFLTVQNCTFRNNKAPSSSGGAIYLHRGGVAFAYDVNFENNRASTEGGAIHLTGQSILTIESSYLNGNSAVGGSGGGILVSSLARMRAKTLVISDNAALTGGGIAALDSSFVVLRDCSIQSNFAGVEGGGIALYSGAYVFAPNCSINSNTADQSAGGVLVSGSLSVFDMRGSLAKIVGNKGGTFGGGMFVAQAKDVYIQANVSYNTAQTGGALGWVSGPVTLHDTAITHNSAKYGGAIAMLSMLPSAGILLDGSTLVEYNQAKSHGGAFFVGSSYCDIRIGDGIYLLNNTALNGGGGAVYFTGTMPLGCFSDICGTPSSTWSPATLSLSDITSSPGDSTNSTNASAALKGHFGNRAVYGDSCASRAMTLRVNFLKGTAFTSGAVSAAKIEVLDAFGTLVLSDNQTTIFAKSDADTLLKGFDVNVLKGVATFDNLVLERTPGSPVSLSFIATIAEESSDTSASSLHSTVTVSTKENARLSDTADVSVSVTVGGSISISVTVNGSMASCRKGTVFVRGALTCLSCEPGSYSLFDGDENIVERKCKACPEAAECPGGYALRAKAGYWQSLLDEEKFLSCPNPSACRGGGVSAPSVSMNSISTIQIQNQSQSAVNQSTCAAGYEGNLCGKCSSGYGRTTRFMCTSCDGTRSSIAMTTAVALVFLAACSYIIVKSVRSLSKVNNSHEFSILTRLFINYIQVMSIVRNINVPWPDALNGLFAFCDTLVEPFQQIFPLECLGSKLSESSSLSTSDSLNPFFLRVVLALSLIGLCALAPLIALAVGRIRNAWRVSPIASAVTAVFLFYSSVNARIFAMFGCSDIGEGFLILNNSPDISCHSAEYLNWLYAAVLPALIFFSVSVPLAFVFVLVHGNKKDRLNDFDFRKHYGFLYGGLRGQYFWFDLVFAILVKKMLLGALCAVIVDSGTQAMCVVVLLDVCLVAAAYCRPWQAPLNNYILLLIDILCLCTAHIALFMVLFNPRGERSPITVALTWIVILTNAIFIICFALYFLFRLWKDMYSGGRAVKRQVSMLIATRRASLANDKSHPPLHGPSAVPLSTAAHKNSKRSLPMLSMFEGRGAGYQVVAPSPCKSDTTALDSPAEFSSLAEAKEVDDNNMKHTKPISDSNRDLVEDVSPSPVGLRLPPGLVVSDGDQDTMFNCLNATVSRP